MTTGIEALNFYGGPACIDVRTIFEARGLDLKRFENLMMDKKSVGLPCEDAVTNAVNAAKPIIDSLTQAEKDQIEMVITSTESGLDFGKSLSTYIHDYLGLSRNCRLFEVKQACYGATAALHLASCFIMSQASPGAKVLVIATDVARVAVKLTYAEPSQAVGAIAILVSENPQIMELDFGATGYYSYEVMDTCRPMAEIETGDPDLSLLSYLDCLENSFKAYAQKVEDCDFQSTFDYLVFHTPFPGMVKGGHRKMMRDLTQSSIQEIETDFKTRVYPSIIYCMQVGNVYSATIYLALCSLIDQIQFSGMKRIGLFSYGSGCSSEFYSGTITPDSQNRLRKMRIKERLESRYPLDLETYDHILDLNREWGFGIKDKEVSIAGFRKLYEYFFEGKGLLTLKKVDNYHREYVWS